MFRPTFESTAKTLWHLDSRKVLLKENFSNHRVTCMVFTSLKTQLETALPMPFEDDLGGLDKRHEQI
mgnify:CR=1 FL=1